MGTPDDAMAAEFDTMAGWTLEVALDLGPDYYLPAACRGSGSPAALRWLIEALVVGPDDRMLDVGAGPGRSGGVRQGRGEGGISGLHRSGIRGDPGSPAPVRPPNRPGW